MPITATPDFMDGIDWLNTAQIAQLTRKWVSNSNTAILTPGRSGITGSGAAGGGFCTVGVTPSVAGILQWGRKVDGFSTVTTFFASLGNDTAFGGFQLLCDSANGRLYIQDTYNSVVLGTATDPAQDLHATGAWYYFELAFTCSASGTGTLDLRLNGQPVAGLYGLTGLTNISSGGTVAISKMTLGAQGGYNDDCYYRIGTSYTASDFLGDIVIETVYPAAISQDAGHNQGVPYGTATNGFDGIDEHPATDETDGIDVGTDSQKHFTRFGALSGPSGGTIGSIKAVQVNCMARKVGSGADPRISPGTFKGTVPGTDYLGASQAIQDTFLIKRARWSTRPDGSGAFVTTDIGTGAGTWEWGFKRTDTV